jgi:hypothetical protein
MRLVYRVTSDLAIVERSLGAQALGAREILAAAIDRFNDGVQLLWEANASIWGHKEAQQHRKHFMDSSLEAATGASGLTPGANPEWLKLKTVAYVAGVGRDCHRRKRRSLD